MRRPPPLLEGVREGGRGDVFYRVIEPNAGEARRGPRRPARLHSAKILDAVNAFLCEALIKDRSAVGLRLLLSRNIGLPARFAVHDDLTGGIVTVTSIWRRDKLMGVRMLSRGPMAPIKPSDRAALGGRYYAVRG